MLSGKRVNKLGDRLRQKAVPDQTDLSELAQFRRQHIVPFCSLMKSIIQQESMVKYYASGRLKSTATIIEKLRREDKMQLKNMHDIAGIRLVLSPDIDRPLEIQKHLASQLLRSQFLIAPRPKNRLNFDPRIGGYRALHIDALNDGRYVEIQVRTSLQHRYAQIFERFADIFGRQIRYGKPPKHGGHIDIKGVTLTRSDIIEQLLQLSQSIQSAEERGDERRMDHMNDDIAVFREVLENMPVHTATRKHKPIVVAQDSEQFNLVVYRRLDPSRLAVHSGSADELLQEWQRLDKKHGNDPDTEIVMLSSTSQESLEVTHSRYFSNQPGIDRC